MPGLTYLRMMCEEFPDVEVVKSFNDPLKFISEVKSVEFDFCILDIEMPGMSGLDVAKSLNGKPVIFTTAYKEYAAEAFDLEAVDYIRKPVKKDRLEKAIQKAGQLIQKNTSDKNYLQLNTSKGKSLIQSDQLIYITTSETDKRDKLFLMEDGKKITVKNISFDALIEKLPAELFCRINKKEIIARKTVRFFTHDEVTVSFNGLSEKKLVLSDIYSDDLVRKAQH